MFPRKLLAGTVFVILLAAGTVATPAQQAKDTAASGQQITNGNTGESPADGQAPALQRRSRYQLRLSDVLALSFPFTPEFDQTVTVQPDGYITLRGAGSIRVEGQTVPEVTEALRTAYVKILREPVITVELREFERPYFVVGGEVGRPGKFDLRGETTVVEAVAIAGGLRDSAKHSQVLIFHRVRDGWVKAKKVNVKKLLQEGNLEEATYLQPGDFIYVPKSTFSKIAPFIPGTSLGAYVNPFQNR
jgi:polysaccharide export outer membrane protein